MKKNFGMWIFLATEVLIFGTLVILYEIFFYRYHRDFKVASRDLHLLYGTLNTFLLLTSSYFVARAQETKAKKNLLWAMLLGVAFLGIKGHEYASLTQEGKFPLNFSATLTKSHELFLSFYAYLTVLHAFHLLVGIACLLWVYLTHRKTPLRLEENVGLYWHFVDIVWVFLYPIFYLAGNS